MTTLPVHAPRSGAAQPLPLPGVNTASERIPRARIVLPALAILYLAATHTYGLSIPRPILLPLGGLVIGSILVKSLQDPTVILLTLAAYIPFSRVYPGNFGGAITALNLSNIFTGVGIVAWLMAAKRRAAPLFPRTLLNLPVMLFAILSVVAFMRGGMDMGTFYWSGAIFNLKRWLDPFLIYFLFLGVIRRKSTMRNLVIVLAMGTLAAALTGIIEHFDLIERFPWDGEKQRILGISEQPNQFGAFLVYYGALFAGLALARPWNRWKVFLLPSFLVIVRATQYTGSRGTLLGLAGALLSMTFLRSKALFVGLALLLGAAAANPSLLPEGTQRMLGRTFANEGQGLEDSLDKSAALRIKLWDAALQMIREQPLLGLGYGLFPVYVSSYVPDVGYRDAHNTYLLLAAEMGVPALIVFLWMLGLAGWEAVRLYRRTADRFLRGTALGYAGGVAGLLLICLFGSRIASFEIFGYFWVLAAIVVRANLMERAERVARADARAPVVGPWVAGVPARTWP